MEIRIDERLVSIFNQVVKTDEVFFGGEKNLEKAINIQLMEFFCYLANEHDVLTEESDDKLFEYVAEYKLKNDEEVEEAKLKRMISKLMARVTRMTGR
jgi:hypothetical protein|nr:MAG TPA: hypothetical protein [Caudoviricetes sp.]